MKNLSFPCLGANVQCKEISLFEPRQGKDNSSNVFKHKSIEFSPTGIETRKDTQIFLKIISFHSKCIGTIKIFFFCEIRQTMVCKLIYLIPTTLINIMTKISNVANKIPYPSGNVVD